MLPLRFALVNNCRKLLSRRARSVEKLPLPPPLPLLGSNVMPLAVAGMAVGAAPSAGAAALGGRVTHTMPEDCAEAGSAKQGATVRGAKIQREKGISISP